MRAFPTEQGTGPDGCWNQTYEPGMSLRDYFAAAAMKAFFTNEDMVDAMCSENDLDASFRKLADATYKMADAMLAARDSK